MKLNKTQERVVELTIQLTQKTAEFNELSRELINIKDSSSDPNDPKLLKVQKGYARILEEVTAITNELDQIKNKL